MVKLDPFKIRDHVADFAEFSARYSSLSALTLELHDHCLDVSYGTLPAERLDLVLPEKLARDAPVHLFIHGGYWRAGSKAEYSYLAEPVSAAGGIAVLVDYALMPQSRMPELVAQVRRAVSWVQNNIQKYGGNPFRLTASGHSAGAHLASYLAATAPHEQPHSSGVKSLLLVSGIYDLAPVPKSFLQAELGLTSGEVQSWSPLDADHAPDVDRTILVGGDETTPFHAQAEEFRAILPGTGRKVHTLPGLNHMSIILDMGNIETEVGRILANLVANS